MKTIEHALDRVQFHVFDGHSYGLAIHKASQETGVPVSDISAELLRRKKVKKEADAKRKAYRAAVPTWAKDC